MAAELEMRLYDQDDHYIVFAYVRTVNEARTLWCRMAGLTAGSNLCRFVVIGPEKCEYEGNYVTDEC